jgi:hypothetical protein
LAGSHEVLVALDADALFQGVVVDFVGFADRDRQHHAEVLLVSRVPLEAGAFDTVIDLILLALLAKPAHHEVALLADADSVVVVAVLPTGEIDTRS